MITKPSIALIGCGYTLERVARKLSAESVVITVRSPEKAEYFKGDFPFVRVLSLDDSEAVAGLFTEFPSLSVIVDSVPPLFKARTLTNEDVAPALVGVKNIVSNLSKLPLLRRLVYLSTTGVFGVGDGSEVTEKTETNPLHPRALARLESEKVYRSLDLETVRLRLSAIYGPGRGIGTALKAGRFKLLGDGASWGNRIQVEDLAQVVYQAIIAEEVPEILCVSDGSPSVQKETVDFYCKNFSLPYPGLTTLEEVRAAGACSRLSNQRIDSSLMLDFIGSLKYPSYKEGARTEFV